MYNALLLVTIAGATYMREIVLAFIPNADPFIELHAHAAPTLTLRVSSTRNRISHKQRGNLSPFFTGALFPCLTVRAFVQGDVPGVTIPKVEKASDEQLLQLDKDLSPWGLRRSMPQATVPAPEEPKPGHVGTFVSQMPAGVVVPTPRSEAMLLPKDQPFNLRVVFTRACAVQWLSKGCYPSKAAVSNVVAGQAIDGLHVIGESDDDETYENHGLIRNKREDGCEPCFAYVPKDAVEIPSTRSVTVEFLDDLQVHWIQGPDWPALASIPNGSKLQFKAVLANPLNPEQVAFILQDNRYALLSSNCFKYLELPAGDLTNLPKFQKPQQPAVEFSLTIVRPGVGRFWTKADNTKGDEVFANEPEFAIAVRRHPNDPHYYQFLAKDGSWLQALVTDTKLQCAQSGNCESDGLYGHHGEKPSTYQLYDEQRRMIDLDGREFDILSINGNLFPEKLTEQKGSNVNKVIGWVEIEEGQTCHTQLADDGVHRDFVAGEFVMVRQQTTKPEGEELLLVDGSTWTLKPGTVQRTELAMWIQIRRAMPIRIFRPRQEDLLVNVPKGARLLVEDIAWTDLERGVSASPSRRFTCSGKDKFAFELLPGEYVIGQTPVRHSCIWINGPDNTDPVGTVNVVCELLRSVTVEIASTTKRYGRKSLEPMRFFAILLEPHGENYIVTLPDFNTFEVNKRSLHIVGGTGDVVPRGINGFIDKVIYS
jgi:hypothetical protein